MVLLDIAPFAATIGTVVSSVIGVYFDRLRRQQQEEEPERAQAAAAKVVEEVSETPVTSVPPVHGRSDPVVASSTELVDAVALAVRSEVEAASKRAEQASMKVNIAFFVAGVLASIAVTLFIHPLH